MKTFDKAKLVHIGPAKCAMDLGDGSERGEYVNQDYILEKLGRPHRAISLMYCYYPLDAGWPGRASVVHASDTVSFAWDYPYDDYFTYRGGIGGDLSQEPFVSMRDVRRHGQDVLLTLTIDPHVSDAHLIAIAKDLSTFGRVMLRINHEATGNWFSFNKRCSYQEVADFFVRASDLIRENAPNVKTIICIGGIENLLEEKMVKEEEFAKTIPAADIWSTDKYVALHWGWPYDIAEEGGSTHKRDKAEKTYEETKRSYLRFLDLNQGVSKPMVMSELNADGDVTGPYEQCDIVKRFCDLLKEDQDTWMSGISFYQFRDRGRLGLEIENPNNKDVGIEQPLLKTYKEIIHDPFFMPAVDILDETILPVTLRWGGAEDATGLSVQVTLEGNPHFAEAYFEGDLKAANLMLELNGHWFYKAPGVTCIDMMAAFFEKPLQKEETLTFKIFAPPASGENDPAQGEDWMENYYTTLTALPKLRIRYGAVRKEG